MSIIHKPLCIRKQSNVNIPSVPPEMRFDSEEFDPYETMEYIEQKHPKLNKLCETIRELDNADMKATGRTYKHFIFSDLKSYYGTKAIASLLSAMDFTFACTDKLVVKPESKLLETRFNNFLFLSSATLFNKVTITADNKKINSSVTITAEKKKSILQTFNSRPNNSYGDLARFIIMDGGYKEGIDLFDIKYIHIFEPPANSANLKQIIGRGTRTCGQQGLKFHPTNGWALSVFVYDIDLREELRMMFLDSISGYDYYLKSLNVNKNVISFAKELDDAVIEGAVDYELNRNIHTFSSSSKQTTSENSPSASSEFYTMEQCIAEHPSVNQHELYRIYVRKNFSDCKWTNVKMENLCIEKATTNNGKKTAKNRIMNNLVDTTNYKTITIPESQKSGITRHGRITYKPNRFMGGEKPKASVITFTPTQQFVGRYFTPMNPLKGMLLYHSVGTGKTCTAIQMATKTFEKEGYTIIWVTRSTLKADIWKNMFSQVCNESIRDALSNGLDMPDDRKSQMKLLSKSWIQPISYKQFSNLVQKKNNDYHRLVKRNGKIDPLRKTLIIIDEAHKLYGDNDLNALERPDMDAFHRAIMNSYSVSGLLSVRLVLMTATPVTNSPMELMQLLNLCRPIEKQFPIQFDVFQPIYLNDDGTFTEKGKTQFLNEIAGQISYLNREKDARQFAQPTIHYVPIEATSDKELKTIQKFDDKYSKFILQQKLDVITNELNELESFLEKNKTLAEINMDSFINYTEKCNAYIPAVKRVCKTNIKNTVSELLGRIKVKLAEIKKEKNELNEKARQIKRNYIMDKEEVDSENIDDKYDMEQGIYYNLAKCSVKQPKLKIDIEPNNEIHNIDMQVDSLTNSLTSLKMQISSYEKLIVKQKRILDNQATNKLPIELLQSSLDYSKKKIIQMRKTESQLKNDRKSLKKEKKRESSNIRKTMKIKNTMDKKESIKIAKILAKGEKIQRKTMKKHKQFVDETANEFYKEMLPEYEDKLNEQLSKFEVKDTVEYAKEEKEKLKQLAMETKLRMKEAKAEAKTLLMKKKAQEKTDLLERTEHIKQNIKLAKEQLSKEDKKSCVSRHLTPMKPTNKVVYNLQESMLNATKNTGCPDDAESKLTQLKNFM